MTDGRTGPDFDDPGFDDPAFDAVRERLAAARVQDPIPADVAARLDATLAGLTGGTPAAPPAPGEGGTTVTPLRRRSRVAPRLLAAAAVVVLAGAGGVGVSQVLDHGSAGDTSSTAGSATKADAPGTEKAPAVPAPTAPAPAGGGTTSLDSLTTAGIAGVPVLTSADFSSQVAALDLARGSYSSRRTTGSDQAAGPQSLDGLSESRRRKSAATARSCRGPRITGTASYPAVLDGQPAVLVVHPADAGSRLVQAWSCDGSRVLAFTTLPD